MHDTMPHARVLLSGEQRDIAQARALVEGWRAVAGGRS